MISPQIYRLINHPEKCKDTLTGTWTGGTGPDLVQVRGQGQCGEAMNVILATEELVAVKSTVGTIAELGLTRVGCRQGNILGWKKAFRDITVLELGLVVMGYGGAGWRVTTKDPDEAGIRDRAGVVEVEGSVMPMRAKYAVVPLLPLMCLCKHGSL